MNVLRAVFYGLLLFKLSLAEAKSSEFNYDFQCTVLGSGTILQNNHYHIETNNKIFLNTKIPGTKEYHDFWLDKCECYSNSGSCRVAVESTEGSKKLRIIVVFTMVDDSLIKNKVTFKDLFQTAEKKGIIKSRDYCNVRNELYFSSVYTYKNSNNKYKNDYIPGYEKPKEMIRNDYTFPIYYNALADYGRINDGKNGSENLFTIIGSYRIDSVVECVSNYADFSSYTIRNSYNRSGHAPTAVACNWLKN
ncbi:hypothetical protein PIROE2DRAFT_61758 [Piromyces sp. E2]|nr:hypothetical protein PIROE2DRAFT_61758 [Piromyces sp. E2]|eukprot:OUM62646.1 hypothetical protein PIROE2DRAFT_61758 [Piromyces sp. E2]